MNHPAEIKTLILKFLKKEASDVEVDDLLRWLKEDESHHVYFDEFNESFQAKKALGELNAEKINYAWRNVASQIEDAEDIKSSHTIVDKRYYNLLRVAASLLLVAVGAFSLWIYYAPTLQTGSAFDKVIVHNLQSRNTPVALPDGSLVWLNTNSTLEYNSDFGKTSREVLLKGEAFFDVKKKRQQNFIVKTEKISIQVKGTRFNVKAYDGEDANTTLEEGKVELTVHGQEKIYAMHPGDQITVVNKEPKITIKKVNPTNFTSWKEDVLVFDNTPLAEIVLKLESRYKVKISIDKSIAKRERLTMTIGKESLDEILEMIQLSSRLNYREEKNKVIIYE